MTGDMDSTELQPSTHPKPPLVGSMLAARSSVGFAHAPSLPTDMRSDSQPSDGFSFQPGQQIDDFQVVALLGRGGFGAVYLAWQVSLGRQVALKVSPCLGQEGRTLARLDHPHIVRVYSETVHQQNRLLCMQYVASMPLDELLQKLAAHKPDWNGQDLLALIDAKNAIAAEFDPAQLADRQKLSELDHVDAVCWIGSRLADALAHAHRHGVLHRDLKPGNVLVSQYGRPMLVDFNLANVTQPEAGTASQLFGGTLPYMSPEHLEAFDPMHPADQALVTQQADIYSLGVVLFELYTGGLPFPAQNVGTISQRISQMVSDRKQPERIWTTPEWTKRSSEPALQSVLQKALNPDPAQRWKSADEFSQALSDVLDLRATLHKVSRSSPVGRWCSARPFVYLTIFGLIPHFVGSMVNIPYNLLRVASRHGGQERLAVFFQLVNVYNVVVYPACVALCLWIVAPVFQWWRRGALRDETDDQTLAKLRKRVIDWPYFVAYIALLGWLPGAIWFPWGLNHWAGPLTWSEIIHLKVSVAVSGLIALTYSALGVLCLSICVFYPRLWIHPLKFREAARREVAPLKWLLAMIPPLAGAIPLIGAILSVTTSPTFDESEALTFRVLTTALIVIGMVGFQFAVIVTGLARQAVDAFAGSTK